MQTQVATLTAQLAEERNKLSTTLARMQAEQKKAPAPFVQQRDAPAGALSNGAPETTLAQYGRGPADRRWFRRVEHIQGQMKTGRMRSAAIGSLVTATTDYLSPLIAALHTHYTCSVPNEGPHLRRAYPGLPAESVATCLPSFLEEYKDENAKSSKMADEEEEHTPELLIVELPPSGESVAESDAALQALEKILRSVALKETCVILLRVGGTPEYHERLASLASYYGQAAVSVLSASSGSTLLETITSALFAAVQGRSLKLKRHAANGERGMARKGMNAKRRAQLLPNARYAATDDLLRAQCFGWEAFWIPAKKSTSFKAIRTSPNSWFKIITHGVSWSKRFWSGWGLTTHPVVLNQEALDKGVGPGPDLWYKNGSHGAATPGVTSVNFGDKFVFNVDSRLDALSELVDAEDCAAGEDCTSQDTLSTSLQFTFLTAPATGVVRVECLSGCECNGHQPRSVAGYRNAPRAAQQPRRGLGDASRELHRPGEEPLAGGQQGEHMAEPCDAHRSGGGCQPLLKGAAPADRLHAPWRRRALYDWQASVDAAEARGLPAVRVGHAQPTLHATVLATQFCTPALRRVGEGSKVRHAAGARRVGDEGLFEAQARRDARRARDGSDARMRSRRCAHIAAADWRVVAAIGGPGAQREGTATNGFPGGPDPMLARARARLASGNGTLTILAVGASVTALFAGICSESTSAATGMYCNTDWDETLEALDERMGVGAGMARKQHPNGHAEDADWLFQVLRALKTKHPNAKLSVRSIGYGGMNPKAIAACAADFVGWPPPDVAIFDFAIFSGQQAEPDNLYAIEALIRAVYPLETAIFLLNMPVWCVNERGRHSNKVYRHLDCQRMVFDRQQSRSNVAAIPLPDSWDAQLSALARHYGLTTISVFNALQPLVASGALDLVDFTQDGKHPHLFPRFTLRSAVYSRYIADLISYAISPSLLVATPGGAVWRGGQWRPIQAEAGAAVPPPRVVNRPRPPMPDALAPNLGFGEPRGVRCYGWGARRTHGQWASTMTQSHGFNVTSKELAYDASSNRWLEIKSTQTKPGVTSVASGDSMMLLIDTSMPEANSTTTSKSQQHRDHPMLQLSYLQSYEQTGVLRIECVSGCTCPTQTVQTLVRTRLATLNTTMWRASEAKACALRFTNVSPRLCDGSATEEHCTRSRWWGSPLERWTMTSTRRPRRRTRRSYGRILT